MAQLPGRLLLTANQNQRIKQVSFSFEVKQEILSLKFQKEQALAFVEGVLATSEKKGNLWVVNFKNQIVGDHFQKILAVVSIHYSLDKNHQNQVVFKHDQKPISAGEPGFFLGGVFVGGGSVSNPLSTSYHLELHFFSHLQAQKTQAFLNKYNFSFHIIKRSKKWVLYIKKAEQISDFLKATQAFNSLLVFEDARIKRDFQNQLNRYSNLDSYNQKKLAISSNNFKKNYAFVKKRGLKGCFSAKELTFFEIKKSYPYTPLSELVVIFNNKTGLQITKSGLNHYLMKITKVVNQNGKR